MIPEIQALKAQSLPDAIADAAARFLENPDPAIPRSVTKLYPGAGVEVVLPTNNFYVGIDPMEEIELNAACFATAGTIERGSYVYNEPDPNDPRVLRFDQVPPVVFSETLTDLKAIIETKA